jgi:hypothetical protein
MKKNKRGEYLVGVDSAVVDEGNGWFLFRVLDEKRVKKRE